MIRLEFRSGRIKSSYFANTENLTDGLCVCSAAIDFPVFYALSYIFITELKFPVENRLLALCMKSGSSYCFCYSREHKLLPARSSVRLNCSSPLGNESSNILDIYSTVCYGYTNCTAVPAQLLGSLKCGEEGKTLDINGNEGRTFQLIGKCFYRNQPLKI